MAHANRAYLVRRKAPVGSNSRRGHPGSRQSDLSSAAGKRKPPRRAAGEVAALLGAPKRGEGLVESSRSASRSPRAQRVAPVLHSWRVSSTGSTTRTAANRAERKLGGWVESAHRGTQRLTGTTAWTLCIFSARVLASSRKGPGAPRRLRTM